MSQPWFPFYVGDYVRDTARLTTEGHGAYLLLMLDYWANGAPPDDDETLSSIARLSPDAWLKLRQKLVSFFHITDGRWTHKRIDKEREIAEEKHQKRVNAGKAGGEAKAKSQQSSSNASPAPPALPYQSQPQPQPLKKDSPTPAKPQARASDEFQRFKKAYPRRDGANPWHTAEKKFNALVKTGVDPEAMIAAAAALAREEGARGKVGTQFIPQAVTWLNQQRFHDYAAASFSSSVDDGLIEVLGEEELAAWDAHARAEGKKSYPRNSRGGWRFPSRWPPGYVPSSSANPPAPILRAM